MRLIGRYSTPKSYDEILNKAIRNEMASFYTFTANGSLRAFGHVFAGSIELLQPEQNLEPMAELFRNFIKGLKDAVIDTLDIESSNYLIETFDVIFVELLKKKNE